MRLTRSITGSVYDLDDLLLIIGAALSANPVGNHKSTTLAALHQSGSGHFPISSPFISMAFRRFIFRADRHDNTSFFQRITRRILYGRRVDLSTVFSLQKPVFSKPVPNLFPDWFFRHFPLVFFRTLIHHFPRTLVRSGFSDSFPSGLSVYYPVPFSQFRRVPVQIHRSEELRL